jgi:hypothetical protein
MTWTSLFNGVVAGAAVAGAAVAGAAVAGAAVAGDAVTGDAVTGAAVGAKRSIEKSPSQSPKQLNEVQGRTSGESQEKANPRLKPGGQT